MPISKRKPPLWEPRQFLIWLALGLAAYALDVAFEGLAEATMSAIAIVFVVGLLWANCEFASSPLAAFRTPDLRSIGAMAVMAVAYTAIFMVHPHPLNMLALLWLPLGAAILSVPLARLFRGGSRY